MASYSRYLRNQAGADMHFLVYRPSSDQYGLPDSCIFPTFLIKGLTAVQILGYSVIVLGISILMSFGANLSRFSIVVAVLMYATCNTPGCLIERLAANAPEKTHGQLIWLISSLLIPVVIIFVTRGRLGLPPAPDSRPSLEKATWRGSVTPK